MKRCAMRLGYAVLASSLVYGFAGRADADTVTYDFVESSGGSGGIGATLTLNTPLPATSASDIVSFQILDFAIAPPGDYTTGFFLDPTTVVSPIGSTTGAMLDSGELTSSTVVGPFLVTIDATFSTTNNGSAIASEAFFLGFYPVAGNTVFGNWQLSTSVPEPSTLVLGVIGALGPLGYSMRRRRKLASG